MSSRFRFKKRRRKRLDKNLTRLWTRMCHFFPNFCVNFCVAMCQCASRNTCETSGCHFREDFGAHNGEGDWATWPSFPFIRSIDRKIDRWKDR